ncbi:hypothetical protein FRC08_009305, partial [Ceratobasidium sp. 394]
RWVGSILNDVTSEVQDTALPLCEIYQVLNACKSNKKLKTQIEAALVAHNVPVKKQHIFEIAESLKVPLKLTWRCETTPKCPGFVVNLASFGTFVGDQSGRSQAAFTRWVPLSTSFTSALLNPSSCPNDWLDKITTRVTFKDGQRLTFKDADIPIIKTTNHRGWLSFENVMRNANGLRSSCGVVLNYWNPPSRRLDDYQAAFDRFAKGNSYPPRTIHYIRAVNLRFKFQVEPNQITVPVYLHRQPCSQSPRHYWGFLSQFADPTVPPEPPVSDIRITYQLDVATALQGDSWEFRADREHEEEYSKMPGAWFV